MTELVVLFYYNKKSAQFTAANALPSSNRLGHSQKLRFAAMSFEFLSLEKKKTDLNEQA